MTRERKTDFCLFWAFSVGFFVFCQIIQLFEIWIEGLVPVSDAENLIYILEIKQKEGNLMPKKVQRTNIDSPNNHTTHHTSSVDIKLINELLQLLRNQHFLQVFSRGNRKKRRSKREPRVGFNLLIPHRLYVRLKNYIELYADRGESMTEIILTGLEKELKKRYAKSPSWKSTVWC